MDRSTLAVLLIALLAMQLAATAGAAQRTVLAELFTATS
jgi:hypothetical protein